MDYSPSILDDEANYMLEEKNIATNREVEQADEALFQGLIIQNTTKHLKMTPYDQVVADAWARSR